MASQAPKKPEVGQTMMVRGVMCRITKVRVFGTVDVVSLCGGFAWRVSGLAF
jgi:hypothetical protein